MIPTILDIKTGRIVTDPSKDFSVFWWTKGNGSCDCNRCISFGDEVELELENHFGSDTCFGCERFIITDVSGDLEGWVKENLIVELNKGYSE